MVFLLSFVKFNNIKFLTFSDGAKFGLVAKSLIEGKGYMSDFTFFSASIFSDLGKPFLASGIPTAMPYSIALFSKLFGLNDFSVIFTSSFYYVLLIIFVFLLGRKIYGNLVGILSGIAVAANINFLQYSTSGASETLFTLLSVVSAYLLFIKKRTTDIIFFVSLVLLYLTRPQGVVFILGLLLFWFIYRFSIKKGLLYFFIFSVGILFIDKFVLYPLSFKYPVYPIVIRGVQALFRYSPTAAVSDALRGGADIPVSYSEIVKKSFYNLYNYYKLLPDIASPYMWGLFGIGLGVWAKEKEKNIFKALTIFLILGSFFLAALTIPFYRYLHPVIPFVYILASGTLVWISEKIFKDKTKSALFASVIILAFTVGQTLGAIFLDTRFEKSLKNYGKPPIYAKLSYILRDNTLSSQIVVTNLDTWGSWYGDRRTIWFPLEPKQLIDSKTDKILVDAIYLTSYLIDDENYYMGQSWRQIFENPKDITKWKCDGCDEIAKEFELKGVYKVDSIEVFEKQEASAILLVRK